MLKVISIVQRLSRMLLGSAQILITQLMGKKLTLGISRQYPPTWSVLHGARSRRLFWGLLSRGGGSIFLQRVSYEGGGCNFSRGFLMEASLLGDIFIAILPRRVLLEGSAAHFSYYSINIRLTH